MCRRFKKQFGVKAKAGPIQDQATPAAGVVDGDPISDDIGLDADVDGFISAFDGVIRTPGVISTFGSAISTPEDRAATEREFLGTRRRGDAGVVTKGGEGYRRYP